jgi:hypothetical protein
MTNSQQADHLLEVVGEVIIGFCITAEFAGTCFMQCIILSDNSLHSILRLFHMLAVVQW